jgi:hypothetical protein
MGSVSANFTPFFVGKTALQSFVVNKERRKDMGVGLVG